MNRTRVLTSAIIAAALIAAAAPAGAQERGGSQERRVRQSSQPEGRQRAQAQGRSEDRQRARQAPAPRAQEGRPYQGIAPRAYESRPYQGERRAVPRSSGQGAYRGDDRSYQHDRRDDGRQAVPRPDYSRPQQYQRPYYYSRPYVRPYRYVPYRPFYFSQPYYTFRPDFDIGFGLWIGSPVPYPYRYLGGYQPRVWGYPYGSYDVGSVSIYGGVSFDIQPADADLFVNGEYVGRVGDFGPYSEPLTLTPGVHRIAVQRDGFRPMEWEVQIEPGRVIPYRGEMERY